MGPIVWPGRKAGHGVARPKEDDGNADKVLPPPETAESWLVFGGAAARHVHRWALCVSCVFVHQPWRSGRDAAVVSTQISFAKLSRCSAPSLSSNSDPSPASA